MKQFKIVFTTILAIVFAFTSCNLLDTKGEINTNKSEEINKISEAFKNEAKYINAVVEENLDIIQICKALDTLDLRPPISSVITSIKHEQSVIQSNLDKLAADNVVILPNSAKEFLITENLPNETHVEEAIIQIQNKRKKQLALLNKLEDNNINDNIKNVASYLKETIEYNLEKKNITLETLR